MSQKLTLVALLVSQIALLISVSALWVIILRQPRPAEREVENLDAALGRPAVSDETVPITYTGTVYPGRDRRPR